jgi:uncharacterized damage-inducible protein DinB
MIRRKPSASAKKARGARATRSDRARENDRALRDHLRRLLSWEDAHAGFDQAVKDWPRELRSVVPEGVPYSAWQLVEHLRLAQRDILEFCRSSRYRARQWPDAYWPKIAAPPRADSWDRSIAAFGRDLEALRRLAADPKIDLFAKIPHGTGQTYLRELILVADHNAYHVGQLVLLRRLLGIWLA